MHHFQWNDPMIATSLQISGGRFPLFCRFYTCVIYVYIYIYIPIYLSVTPHFWLPYSKDHDQPIPKAPRNLWKALLLRSIAASLSSSPLSSFCFHLFPLVPWPTKHRLARFTLPHRQLTGLLGKRFLSLMEGTPLPAIKKENTYCPLN